MIVRLLLIGLLVLGASCERKQCLSRQYSYSSTVCVCNSNHCDNIPPPEKPQPSSFLVYTSNKAGLRFDLKTGQFGEDASSDNKIYIHAKEKFQEVLGWGGAFTDATGINIKSLDEDLQEQLLRSYFSDEGLEYSLCRVPIGGTDFSLRGYSYNDGDEDKDLVNFALAPEDFDYKIPYINKARDLTSGNLKLFASAWTAPKWMKTNGEYDGSGRIFEEMYQVWANYFVKFLDFYKGHGLEFWGITTGNEPSLATSPTEQINNVGWLSTDLGMWLLNNLGPTIRSSNHFDIKIMILEDQRLYLPWFVQAALKDNITRSYVDGIAFHWYLNVAFPAILLTDTHDIYPEKFLLSTEACIDFLHKGEAVMLGSWENGEDYSADIIEDVLNWAGGWVDWNLVLDLTGGPNYINNFVDSPIIVNATAGEFYKQPMFYHLGHFSKFVPRGSVRIGANSEGESKVMSVAFQRPDNGIAVVILNKREDSVQISLHDDVKGSAQLELSAKSITTIIYW